MSSSPAPWTAALGTVDELSGVQLAIWSTTKKDGPVALISPVSLIDDQDLADAALIIAAPAMLAKLQEIAGTCAECGGSGETDGISLAGRIIREPCPDCADIRQVIALARTPIAVESLA